MNRITPLDNRRAFDKISLKGAKKILERRDGDMELRLTDIEANAVKHSLDEYVKNLEKSGSQEKGIKLEEDAAKRVIEKMVTSSGASGT
jgi:hypothetical protein